VSAWFLLSSDTVEYGAQDTDLGGGGTSFTGRTNSTAVVAMSAGDNIRVRVYSVDPGTFIVPIPAVSPNQAFVYLSLALLHET
jgi:hypothetical protein